MADGSMAPSPIRSTTAIRQAGLKNGASRDRRARAYATRLSQGLPSLTPAYSYLWQARQTLDDP